MISNQIFNEFSSDVLAILKFSNVYVEKNKFDR